jgi:excisionase family DNA binding protein
MATDLTAEISDRRLLGLEAAAAYLDTTPRTIQRLIARGVLAKVSIPTLKRVLIAREDLDQLIEPEERAVTVNYP